MLKFFAFICLLSLSSVSGEQKTIHKGAARKGFYTGLTSGRLFYTGQDRSLYRDGWVVGFRAGYDILKYLGIEGQFRFSAHSATTGTVLTNIPLSFFNYQVLGALRGAYPITQRLYVQAAAGGGLFLSSPNQNRNSNNSRGMFYGELGLEYFMRSRGISVGIDPSLSGVKDLKGAIVQATGFLRYTF